MNDLPAAGPVADAERVFGALVDGWVDARLGRVDGFARQHFGLRGTLRVHRAALGPDLLRAPANLFLAVPHLLKGPAAALARRAGAPRAAAALARLPTQLRTDVEREVERLVRSDLLAGGAGEDAAALARAERALRAAFGAPGGTAAAERTAAAARDLRRAFDAHREDVLGTGFARDLARYTAARVSAAEITAACLSAAAGAALVHQLTPTAFSLGPSLAALGAREAAVEAFPLGPALGAVWYAAFPVEPSPGVVVAVTVALLVAMSIVAAFAGVVADPVQRALGLHRRRLRRLVGAAGEALRGPDAGRFRDRTHYVARMFDVLETLRAVLRALS